MSDRVRLSVIVRRLQAQYGSPRHGNIRDAFWELVYILFSIRTAEAAYLPAFRKFRKKYKTVREVASAPIKHLERELRPLGLSSLRARQLSSIAKAVDKDYGQRRLNEFARRDHVAFEAYLQKFHGIGSKIAKCVSMYAFDAPSLPVDVHVWRVLSRLGYAPGGRVTEVKRLALEREVPEALRLPAHVLAISHGRAVCRSRPKCAECVINDLCPSSEV